MNRIAKEKSTHKGWILGLAEMEGFDLHVSSLLEETLWSGSRQDRRPATIHRSVAFDWFKSSIPFLPKRASPRWGGVLDPLFYL